MCNKVSIEALYEITVATVPRMSLALYKFVECIKTSFAQPLKGSMMRNVREKLYGNSSVGLPGPLHHQLWSHISPAASSAHAYEEELVRNHLRLLYSVHQNRETLMAGSYPEPPIAEAAAQIMHAHNGVEEPHMNLWHRLGEFLDHGLRAQDTIGKLIGRTLRIISAMDHAINALPEVEVRELTYQTPVKTTAYYQAFLTDEAWHILRKFVPANRLNLNPEIAEITFETAFRYAYFHFCWQRRASLPALPRREY